MGWFYTGEERQNSGGTVADSLKLFLDVGNWPVPTFDQPDTSGHHASGSIVVNAVVVFVVVLADVELLCGVLSRGVSPSPSFLCL